MSITPQPRVVIQKTNLYPQKHISRENSWGKKIVFHENEKENLFDTMTTRKIQKSCLFFVKKQY